MKKSWNPGQISCILGISMYEHQKILYLRHDVIIHVHRMIIYEYGAIYLYMYVDSHRYNAVL